MPKQVIGHHQPSGAAIAVVETVNGHKIAVEFRRLNNRLGARLAGERHQCGDQLSRSASEAGGVTFRV